MSMKQPDRSFTKSEDYYTLQEQTIAGFTGTLKPGAGGKYIPIAVLKNEASPKEARLVRRGIGGILKIPTMTSTALGFRDQELVMSLSDIDEKTGETISDPRFIGVWNKDKEEVVGFQDPQVETERIYGEFKKLHYDVFRREVPPPHEGTPSAEGRGV